MAAVRIQALEEFWMTCPGCEQTVVCSLSSEVTDAALAAFCSLEWVVLLTVALMTTVAGGVQVPATHLVL